MKDKNLPSELKESRTGVASLIQVNAKGVQDTHIHCEESKTEDCETWKFQQHHKQYSHFGMDSHVVTFDEDVQFGKKLHASISQNTETKCDLFGDMYLLINLPPLVQHGSTSSTITTERPTEVISIETLKETVSLKETNLSAPVTSFTDITWTKGSTTEKNTFYNNKIGFDIIEYFKIYVDNQELAYYTPESLEFHHNMTIAESHKEGLKEMIGIHETKSSLIENGKKEQILYVPIPFMHTKTYRQYFPLLAMSKNKLRFELKLKSLVDIVNIEDDSHVTVKIVFPHVMLIVGHNKDVKINSNYTFDCKILFQTFNISSIERSLFLNTADQEYLYKRSYIDSFEISKFDTKIDLNFIKNNVEFIVFAFRYNTSPKFEYDKLESLQIRLNNLELPIGNHRQPHPEFYNLIRKYNYTDYCENDNLYYYNFCLKSGHGQPTGSINFSKLKSKEVELKLIKEKDEEGNVISSNRGTLYIFYTNYNVIQCDGKDIKLLFY